MQGPEEGGVSADKEKGRETGKRGCASDLEVSRREGWRTGERETKLGGGKRGWAPAPPGAKRWRARLSPAARPPGGLGAL